MRLDHIAYRVADRNKTAQFFMDAFGYKKQTEFDLVFADGSTAECIVLEPPEKLSKETPWTTVLKDEVFGDAELHLAPELFVSDGAPGSIVGNWVANRDGVGGIHHIAYMVDSVENTMNEWQEKGYAEFLSEKPLVCEEDDPDLKQVFTKPSELTGVIYEFIERGGFGFCKANVKDLMRSTRDCK